ncbi:MAG: hypothetical protein CMJ21_01860 [Phycisphaerae bacterium]|nr:hypothetical protein [Phycisphaerae bacterium]
MIPGEARDDARHRAAQAYDVIQVQVRPLQFLRNFTRMRETFGVIAVAHDEARHARDRWQVHAPPRFDLARGECFVVVPAGEHDRRVRRVVRLHVNGARVLAASASARNLCEHLERALRRAKVGQMKRCVRADHAHDAHVWEIKPLGDHLRAHEHLYLPATKLLERFVVMPARAHRVRVHARRCNGRKLGLDLLFDALCAQAEHGDALATYRAYFG